MIALWEAVRIHERVGRLEAVMPELAGDRLPFHLRIRFRRETEGLRQWQLAQALGIHNTLLSAYENGRRMPPDPARFERSLEAAITLALRGARGVDEAASTPAADISLRCHGLPAEAADACIDLLRDLARLTGADFRAALQAEPGRDTFTLHVSGVARTSAVQDVPARAVAGRTPVRLPSPAVEDADRPTG